MDFRLKIGVLALVLGGCGCVQEGSDTPQREEFTLKVTFQNNIPYCGGMAPTPEMADGTLEPLSGAVYYIYKDELPTASKDFTKVAADENGVISVKLAAGTYYFIEKDKRLSLEEFIKAKKIDGQYYKNGPDTCFERWKSTPDYTVTITENKEDTVTVANRCFTGSNPCLQYDGPYPP
jgi:hypothetical protein